MWGYIMNLIKSLIGEESLLLILPKKVSLELDIANKDWLKFEVKDKQLVINKLENKHNPIDTNIA